jgi:D-apionate oxidoisomerase
MGKVALIGAGGKMGVRLMANLVASPYAVAPVEVSAEARARVEQCFGRSCVPREAALAGARFVILAVPDRAIGAVLSEIVDAVAPGTAFVILDAAAAHAGDLPGRTDVTYFVTHPCHPPLFNDEATVEAKRDFFGGSFARQHVVCALAQGPEADYAVCEQLARTIYAPVMRAHRCTVEQIAMLEPALAETIACTLCLSLREAAEAAIRRGVPREAAMDFLLGHLNIALAIAFEAFPEGRFSDGALQAIAAAKPEIFRDGWLDRIFDPAAVRQSVEAICHPEPA